MPKLTFESTPKRQQRIHIEGDMRDRAMHKRRRKQSPELARTDQVIVLCQDRTREIRLQKDFTRQLQNINDDSDGNDGIRHIRGRLRQRDAHRLFAMLFF